MPLNDKATVDFIKTINRRSKVPLVHNDVIVSPVYPKEDIKTTQLRLTTLEGAAYGGSEILTYTRLNLAYLDTMLFQQPNIYPKNSTLYQILGELRDGFGIFFDENDLEDAPVTEQQGVFNVLLKAKDSSYRWYGEYPLKFTTLPDISRLVKYDVVYW